MAEARVARVLVVDDDESSRYLLVSLLRAEGFDVLEAVDGADALRQARALPVDLLVTDILMPVMDGYQLCREWKADAELSRAPLVFYSATYTDPADMRFADGLGADAFLIKPQEPAALVAVVRRLLGEAAGDTAPRPAPRLAEETEVLREYNERLVSKLEHKLVELDRTNAELRRTLEVLSDEVDVKRTLIEQLTHDAESRTAEQGELLEANEILSRIVHSSPLAIIAVDLDWVVRLWNPAAERLLGWSADEVLGTVYPPARENTAEFARSYEELLTGHAESVEIEAVRPRRDGSLADLRVYAAALFGRDGTLRGIVSLSADITAERQIEMVKSDFMSMVSHELRTPLTAIIGYSDLLEQVDFERKPELFRQLIEKIRDRGNRMRLLIDNLLDASQIQSGPMRLDLVRSDIVPIARRAAEGTELGPAHRLDFVADEVPPLFLDEARIDKVLRQLLSNAVKYSPDGGRIGVVITRENGFVRIDVSDEGVGIDPADQTHIFHDFTQADMSDTRSFGGIGVGLFLARQTIEAHRGHIEVSSTPGEGATFTITLPVLG